MGFEGEAWDTEIPGLVIPVPGTNAYVIVIFIATLNNFGVVTMGRWVEVDNILLASALVNEVITLKGNFDGFQEKT